MLSQQAPNAAAFQRRLKLAIASLTAVVLLVLAGLRAYDLWQRRTLTLQAGERRAANLALMIATQMRAAFAAADSTLRQLAGYSRQVGGPAAPAGAWNEMLALSRTQRNGLGSLSVLDAEGVVRHSTVRDIVGSSRRDSYLFRRITGTDRDLMQADTPFRSTTNPQLMLIPLGRRLVTRDGAFDGVIAGTFTPAHLRDFFQQLDLGRGSRIDVFHPEGIAVFRVPANGGAANESAAGDPFFELARQSAVGSVAQLRGEAGAPDMLMAVHSTGEPRLIVAVSLSEPELIAEWHREVAISLVVLALVTVVLVLLVRLVFRELDARAAAEEALSRAQRLDALGKLTGGVAHDFNNLLTVIMMNLSLLKLPGGAGASGSPDEDKIDEIEKAAQRAASLTRQLLTFARRQPIQPKLLDLNELVRELAPMLARMLGESIPFRLELAGDPCLAEVDRVQLETALINLCANARDAMPNGGSVVLATDIVPAPLEGARSNGAVQRCVRITVRDTGTGIDPEHLPHVCEPFFTTKPVGKGTGLGLSTVYGFMQQSRGSLKIDSEPGRGTAVQLMFPLAAGTPEPPPADRPLTRRSGNGELILLLEDEAVVRQVAEMMLGKLGYRVISATTGPEALDRARELPRIDLFLTDIVLPGGMNGRQVAEILQRERPGLRVLYATGYSQDVLNDGGSAPPNLRLISKPYDFNTLADAVRAAIDDAPVDATIA